MHKKVNLDSITFLDQLMLARGLPTGMAREMPESSNAANITSVEQFVQKFKAFLAQTADNFNASFN